MKKKFENNFLILFTSQYPYGYGETFIENEIDFLSKGFEKVYIFPFSTSKSKRTLPENIVVVDLFSNSDYNRNEVLKNEKILLFKILFQEFIQGNLFNKEYKNTISRLLQLFSKSYILEKWFKENSIIDSVFYSYWFEDWATIKVPSNVCTRS